MLTTDCHFPPPPWLSEELPEHLRSKVMRLEERADGVYLVRPTLAAMASEEQLAEVGAMSTQPDRTALLNMGVKVNDPDDERELARIVQGDCAAESHPTFQIDDLIAELEADGVAGGVLISSFGNPSGDLEVDIAWCRLANDWLAEQCRDHMHRFAPGIQLPLTSVEESVKELERAAAMGMRPALLPDVHAERPWYDAAWEPLWEALEGLDVPITMHVSASARAMLPWSAQTSFKPGIGATAGLLLVSSGMAESALWFASGGILERHPGLRVVFTECGAGWFAWAMDLMDYAYFGRFGNEFCTDQGFPPMRLCEFPPSYYLKRQTACTFMDDRVAVHNRELTTVDALMWGNDWPHQEGVQPNSREVVAKMFDGVPDADVRAITHDNAARTFRLTA